MIAPEIIWIAPYSERLESMLIAANISLADAERLITSLAGTLEATNAMLEAALAELSKGRDPKLVRQWLFSVMAAQGVLE